MPVRRFRSILDECLTAVRQGESIEACISRYPRHEERLRPLLTLAQRVSQTPAAGPRPRAQEIAWDRVRQRARELRRGRRFPSLSFPWLRPVALAASLVLALLAATGGVAYASQDSLPDGPLYRIKLATEDVRLWFAFDDTGRAEILLDQSDERTAEIVEMVQRGKAIPGNVLSALKDRNERAARIVEEQPPQSPLIERLLSQSEAQEGLLLAVRQIVSTSAIDEYGEVVATPPQHAAGRLSVSGLPSARGSVWGHHNHLGAGPTGQRWHLAGRRLRGAHRRADFRTRRSDTGGHGESRRGPRRRRAPSGP